jgi:hypothetical protein
MLMRRFGSSLQSVEPDFDPRALSEVTFRRDGKSSIPLQEWQEEWERVRETALAPAASAPVQIDAEQALLDHLRRELDEALAGLSPGEILLVENVPGVDWPKTREHRENVVVEGENRFHFHWRLDPPLRVASFRRGGS